MASGASVPKSVTAELETPGHVAVAFSWSHRDFAVALARFASELASDQGADIDLRLVDLRKKLEPPFPDDNAPEMIRDTSRTIPIIAVTGTNGKTTTTRLIAAILRGAGRRVGWCTSVGVYIEGELVLNGDYTGPSGAARVFAEPDMDVAVLETARGGILLRGLGYESNDVSVVTNVSADHLGLHGVYSVEGLARVKRIVPEATREGGFAVLNAEDTRVLTMRERIRARPFLVTRQSDHDDVARHIDRGGWALRVDGDDVVWSHDGQTETLTTVQHMPMTIGGRAAHMLENALCGAAACLALGLSAQDVREGLAKFRNRSDQNRGRLNVYRLGEVTVIIDFAHNEAGLRHLLSFARSLTEGNGQVTAVIGTAGDRDDNTLRGLATLAANEADRTIIKDLPHYLRGREVGEMPRIMRDAFVEVIGTEPELVKDERSGLALALKESAPGDVLAIMCLEDFDSILKDLDRDGEQLS